MKEVAVSFSSLFAHSSARQTLLVAMLLSRRFVRMYVIVSEHFACSPVCWFCNHWYAGLLQNYFPQSLMLNPVFSGLSP